MDRYYRFSQKAEKFTQEEVELILQEVREIPGLKDTEIIKDGEGFMYLGVSAEQDKLSEVMTKIVNICSRISKCEISFAGFKEQFCR